MTPDGGPERDTGRRGISRPASGFAVLVGYLTLSCWLWRSLLGGLTSRTFGGDDAYLITWWLRWTPFALEHGHLPLRTGWLDFPHGVNAMWNTSLLLLGVLAWPVTSMLGPLASYNILLIAAPAVSGWVCYLAAARLFGSRWPAAAAGLIYGFSPFFIGQSAGHLQMTWALFPPLALLLVAELVVYQRMPTRRTGVILGLAVGLQLLTGEEMLASTMVLAGISVLVLAAIHRHEIQSRYRYVLQAGGWAVLSAVAVDAVPLYVQFFGPQQVHGQVQTQAPGADLLSFVVPGPLQLLQTPGGDSFAHRVVGPNLSEQTAYVGLPLLILVVWGLTRLPRPGRDLLLVPLATAGTLTLGRHLVVGGHATDVPLPAGLLAHVPLAQSMLPVRFSLFVFLGAAMVVAAWLAKPSSPRQGVLKLTLLGAACLTLLPTPFRAFPVQVPAFFRDLPASRMLPADSAAFVAPYPGPGSAAPMLWQAEAGMRFRMVGGYFLGPGPTGKPVFGEPPGAIAQVVFALSRGQAAPAPTSPVARAVVAEITADQLDEIIVGPMPHASEVAAFFQRVLARPARYVGGVWLIRLST